MDATRFDDLIDIATTGLKDDPELRLAVKAELSDHLEESVRTLASEGNSELESRELAAQAFGSPLDVSNKLLTANKGRMRLRALARLTIRALLVPAALLLALYLAWGTLAQTQQELGVLKSFFDDSGAAKNRGVQIAKALESTPRLPSAPFQHSLEEQVLGTLMNEAGQENPSNAQLWHGASARFIYNLWKKEPTNKIYYAHYATYASGNCIDPPEGENTLSERDAYINLMRAGERIDPDNALYNYLICDRILRDAVAVRTDRTVPAGYRTELTDRTMLESAMQEYRAGLRKPYYQVYHPELLQNLQQSYPTANRLNNQMLRFRAAGSLLAPELNRLRNIARVVPYYGRLLRQEGHKAEADAMFASRIVYPRQIARGDKTLIGQLVAKALYAIIAKGAADDYAQTGQVLKAQRITRQLEAMKSLARDSLHFEQPTHGILTLFLPWRDGKYLRNGDLLPITQVEHIALEEAALAVVLIVLVIIMLCYGAAALHWRMLLWQSESVPVLLLPDGTTLLRILLLGVLAPACVYVVMTHVWHPPWRAASITQSGGYTLLFMGLLALALLILPVCIARRYIRQRCYQLGLPLPQKGTKGNQQYTWYYQYTCYYGTLAQSMLPVFAAVVIFLGGVFYPYLVSQEQRWIKRDRVLFWQGKSVHALSPLEDRMITDTQAGIMRVLQADERESGMTGK